MAHMVTIHNWTLNLDLIKSIYWSYGTGVNPTITGCIVFYLDGGQQEFTRVDAHIIFNELRRDTEKLPVVKQKR
jgi:hypothetical protein